MSSSPVSGAIGALQAGQGQTRELMQELHALAQAGMNLACFDLAAGSLEQHLDLAEHVAEVGPGLLCPSQTPNPNPKFERRRHDKSMITLPKDACAMSQALSDARAS